MEFTHAEAWAKLGAGAVSQAVPDDPSQHVAARLARTGAVAFDLRRGHGLRIAAAVGHPLDGLIAGPALVVNSGVDDHPPGSEQGRLQEADATPGIVLIHADLVGELFRVEAPAFSIAREALRPPDQR